MNAPRTNVRYIDTDALCNEAEEVGMAWADAKAAYEALTETRKSVLAMRQRRYFEEGMAGNKAETLALGEPDFLEFINRMVKAGHAADRARVKYDILKTRIELLRTNASTERAAMSMR